MRKETKQLIDSIKGHYVSCKELYVNDYGKIRRYYALGISNNEYCSTETYECDSEDEVINKLTEFIDSTKDKFEEIKKICRSLDFEFNSTKNEDGTYNIVIGNSEMTLSFKNINEDVFKETVSNILNYAKQEYCKCDC